MTGKTPDWDDVLSRCRAVLLYGPNEGATRRHAAMLRKKIAGEPPNPFQYSEYSEETLAAQPEVFFDDVSANSLTGERRLVQINLANEDGGDRISAFLSAPPPNDTMLVVRAGKLGPRARLRTLFEKSSNAYAVPCYALANRDRSHLLAEWERRHGYRLAPEARQWLAEHLGDDQALSEQELAKLALYARAGEAPLSLEEVHNCITDNAEYFATHILDAAFGGEREQIFYHLDENSGQTLPPEAMIRALANHNMKLILWRSEMDAGTPNPLEHAKPYIHPFRRRKLHKQLQRWSSALLARNAGEIIAAERALRFGAPAHALLGHLCRQILALPQSKPLKP